MTPQYILRKSLCRPAHCFSSYVDGQGYIGKTCHPDYKAQRDRKANQEIENLEWASDYAEPGYKTPEKGIVFADWNVFPTVVCSILERYGYEIEWSDEWSICGDCGKAVRTQPDGYCWKPYWNQELISNGEFCCLDCAPEEKEA